MERKRKLADVNENNGEDGVIKKTKNICWSDFRKELDRGNFIPSLKNFLNLAEQDSETTLNYLEAGGSPQELLLLLDPSAKADLTSALPVFKVLHLIFLSIKDNNSKFYADAEECARLMLESFSPTIEAMMNISSKKYRKIILKVLTSVVTLFPSFSRLIMKFIPTSSSVIDQFLKPQGGTDSVRKWFIFFILSFIIGGDYSLIRTILTMKGLLASIMNHLRYDEAHTVSMFLSVVREKILENAKVSKTLKLQVFNNQVVTSLFGLYDWKGPKNINTLPVEKGGKEKEVSPDDKDLVTGSVHAFLLVLCTSKKLGVAFSDSSFGFFGEKKNNLLSMVIESLSEPWKNERMSELLIKMVVTCPDLLRPTLSRMDSAIQPRESGKWNSLLHFVENLLEALSPKDILKNAVKITDVDIIQLAKYFCCPSVLMRNMAEGLKYIQCFPIIYYSMRVLTLMWKNVEEVIVAFEDQPELKKTLISLFGNCFMELEDIVSLWENVCISSLSLGSVCKTKFLSVILDFVEMNSKCNKKATDFSPRIASKMLETLDTVKDKISDMDYIDIQSRTFYLVISVDPMSVTPESELFQKAITLLLSRKNKSNIESLTKIILSTGIFENNESEIDIWLACYYCDMNRYQEYIPQIFADCICCLYLREISFDSTFIKSSPKKKSLISELMETDTSILLQKKWINTLPESPTPMLLVFLEQLKSLLSSGSGKEMKVARNYVSHVVFRLLHFYNDNKAFQKICREYEDLVNDAVLNYVEGKERAEFYTEKSIFLTDEEKQLMPWLYNRKKQIDIEKTFNRMDCNTMKLFLIYNTIISYLHTKVSNDCLDDEDVSKLDQCFMYFLNFGEGVQPYYSEWMRILSYNVESFAVFRFKCIQRLFTLPFIEKFDVCECENSTVKSFTKLMTNILMQIEKEEMQNLVVCVPWKQQFLDRVKTNLQDNCKAVEIFGNLEPILDRFQYTYTDILDILNHYSNIKGLKNFVREGDITISTLVLTKFIKMQSDHSNINEKSIKQLVRIMRHTTEGKAENFKMLCSSFLYVIKRCPESLSFIENEFFEAFMRTSDFNDDVKSFGNVLLSDPNKVHYFVTFATNNFKELKNKKLIVAMVATLVRKKSKFLDLLRSHKLFCYWRESELSCKENFELSELMKMIYKKFNGDLWSSDSKNTNFILQYSDLFSALTKCFLVKENLLDLMEVISKGSFLPEVIHETILNYCDEEVILENYVRGLLSLFTLSIKDSEKVRCDEVLWSKHSKYVFDLTNKRRYCKWSSIANSSIWRDFVRQVLRLCFSFPNCPSLLKTTRHLFELFYEQGENCHDVEIIFEMLISHSQFLSSMLQRSPLKLELAKFYYSAVRRNSKLLSAKHIPIILASYSGSLSEVDVTLLNILRFYETSNICMNEYEPFLWGEPAVNHYSVKSNIGVSLWRKINMLNVLELLDAKRIDYSLKQFPINRTMKMEEENIIFNERVYDPAFLLPMFANLLSPGEITYCLAFIQKGCFAYTLCALSCVNKEVRIIASLVLARLYNHLELVQNMKLKSVWLHFINCLRYAVEDIALNPLPSVVTFFLAKASLELSSEPGEMYISLKKFLLAKPFFSIDCIPEFLPLFHSSDVNYVKHRRWILEILRDGFKQNADLDLLFQTMAIKLILSYFRSQICNRESKLLVLEVLVSILKTDKAKLLISEYGLLTWLYAVSFKCDKELFNPFMKVVSAATYIVKTKLLINVRGKRNLFYAIQILNILMKNLPILSECRSIETIELVLNISLECLTLLLEFKHKNWCKSNKRNLNTFKMITMKALKGNNYIENSSKSKFFVAFCTFSNDLEYLLEKVFYVCDILLEFD